MLITSMLAEASLCILDCIHDDHSNHCLLLVAVLLAYQQAGLDCVPIASFEHSSAGHVLSHTSDYASKHV